MKMKVVGLLKGMMFFLSVGVLTWAVLMAYDLSTNGISIAGEYKTYYMSDVVEWLKSFVV